MEELAAQVAAHLPAGGAPSAGTSGGGAPPPALEQHEQQQPDTNQTLQQQQSQQPQQPKEPGDGAAGTDAEDGDSDDFDPELATWLARTLQRLQPGAELTVGSVKVLEKLLDEITVRVLDEAQRINSSGGEAGAASSAPGPQAAAPAAGADQAAVKAGTAAPPPPPQQPQQQPIDKKGKQQKSSALTSLDIHKALKRVLPGEPASNKLRPYLPAVTKQAWHLDKQSLKGIKRQKQAVAAGSIADECGGGSGSNGGKENAQDEAA